MNTTFKNLALGAVALSCIGPSANALGGVIASWDFTGQSGFTSGGSSLTLPASSSSAPANSPTLGATTTTHSAANVAETTIGASQDTMLQMVAFGGSPNLLNSSITLHLNPTSGQGNGNYNVSFDATVFSGTGTVPQTWAYSYDGSSWTAMDNPNQITVPNSSAALTHFSISATGLNVPGTTLDFRGLLGSSSSTAQVAFDNFQVDFTAVPEPIHYALGIFGLLFVGTSASKFWLGRMRRA